MKNPVHNQPPDLLSCAACSINSLQDGVIKLEETGRIVKGLKRELTELQPLLESKASEAEGLLTQVCPHRGISSGFHPLACSIDRSGPPCIAATVGQVSHLRPLA